MIRLHISREEYAQSWRPYAPMMPMGKATPLCGANDGRGIIRRGDGPGLLRLPAVSTEFHCPECVAELRGAKVNPHVWTADEMDRWEFETDQILGTPEHEQGCRCPQCDPDYNDPRNYSNDPSGDDYR